MTVSLTTLKLACELASVWMVGIVAIVALVVVAVDRLNVRIAELEERIRVLSGEPTRRETDSRHDRPVPTPAPAPVRSWSWPGSRCRGRAW